MDTKIERKKALKLLENIQDLIYKNIDLGNYFQADTDDRQDFDVLFTGVSNGFISEMLYCLFGEKLEVTGTVEELFPCPCCGFKTLTERFDPAEGTGYDICPYCNWEDDGETDPESSKSINRGSMADYRKRMAEDPNRYYIEKWLK